jgi:hypothetical protein
MSGEHFTAILLLDGACEQAYSALRWASIEDPGGASTWQLQRDIDRALAASRAASAYLLAARASLDTCHDCTSPIAPIAPILTGPEIITCDE